MIAELRVIDDETAVAVGERYDFEQTLDAMCGLIDDYAAFAAARGLETPFTLSDPAPRETDDWLAKLLRAAALPYALPYGRHTTRKIRLFAAKERELCDAGGLKHVFEAPPFRFELCPLGYAPLYANFGMCRVKGLEAEWTTVDGAPWTDYDPAPRVSIYRHLPRRADDAPERPDSDLGMTVPQRRLLTEFLETQRPRGFEWSSAANGLAIEPVILRCPHERFGAGRGPIRIALLRAGGD